MIVLGITDGHDAGAALLKDGKILAAVNEERFVREKLFTGVPKESIKEVLALGNIQPQQIDKVAIATKQGIQGELGWERASPWKKTYQLVCKNFGFLAGKKEFTKLQNFLLIPLRTKETEQYLRSIGVDCQIYYYDHHLCHAASAYYTSGKEEALVITSDGSGDGLSSTVYIGKDNNLGCINEIPTYHSIGYYYAYITLLAGFNMFRHEGKITGLAAYGDSNVCYSVLEKCFSYSSDKGQPINSLGLMGEHALAYLKKELQQYDRKEYSAAIQRRTEDVMVAFLKDYVKKTKISDVCFAGGLFANVRVNQKIAELEEVDSFFVHPHMGDGGLGLGAALYCYGQERLNKGSGLKPFYLSDVYFGRAYSNEDVEEALAKNHMLGEKIQNIEKFIAEQLAKKKIVGHFSGRMEYGPRALGNRSILADPTDTSINDWLNKRLRRTEFMPFAPSVIDIYATRYYANYLKSKYPAQFMTVTFDNTKEAQKAPAVVHVDNTARPQVVNKLYNPRYYKILQEYFNKTGLPLFVNTSFNAHEEPILWSPENAINSFKENTVDVLVMENWVLRKNER